MRERQRKIIVTITIDRTLFEAIEQQRGMIPRSPYIAKILSRYFNESKLETPDKGGFVST